MDEKGKLTYSYQLDQDILDSRGINMTVEEVASLPTVQYAEKVHGLHLADADLAFLKGLRRRIKNRLASQNSRRRNMEQLHRLTRELRAVKESKGDALYQRSALLEERYQLFDKCSRLREYIEKNLKDKSEMSALPVFSERVPNMKESQNHKKYRKISNQTQTKHFHVKKEKMKNGVFECRLEKLVQQSVDHIYKDNFEKVRRVCAKTIFLTNGDVQSDVKSFAVKQFDASSVKSLSMKQFEGHLNEIISYDSMEVMNLSLKENEKKRSHGRKQTAPRRITYVGNETEDCVLDLKVKKEGE